MSHSLYTVIRGTGHYLPALHVKNEDFLRHEFLDEGGVPLDKTNREIIEKFEEITTIAERRYVTENQVTSDIAFLAAQDAITTSGIDKESLDYIIMAHNFGDVTHENRVTDIVPSLASRVKSKLEIHNPETVAYDITFGCPGWLQAVIQADYFIRSGDAKRILVIGAEVLSRVSDPHDRDSMLYADGAGAVILEGLESDQPTGILAHKTRSDTLVYSHMLHMDKSYHPNNGYANTLFLKMNGRKLYQDALETVPQAIKACLEKSGKDLREIKAVLIHQANGKMDDAILKRLYSLYGMKNIPNDVMPMTIAWLGNSSVATLPTLYDLIVKRKLPGYDIEPGDTIVFASVGAGMNINTVVYQA